ncbi:MAG: hypothetical protein HYZ29_14550 [Myxococcales bacterium]|nr:hypothetical protein [Myxococcales bacterium]
MDTRRAWALNLDADLELAALGSAYAPPDRVLRVMRARRAELAPRLLGPGDLLVDESSPPGCAKGLPGRAFCPTPRALALLERAGAAPEPAPPASVLREVNGRAFCSRLGATLPAALFVRTEAEAFALLRSAPPAGFEAWRVKRAFGMAGRGQRVLAPGSLSAADAAFVRAGLERDGLCIEPSACIVGEYAVHGVLAPDGSVRFGAVVQQRCDRRGAWLATEPLAGPFPFGEALAESARRVAAALHAAGYFGPFGVDAYTHRVGAEVCFNPRSEINARYSMGFAVGFRC